MDASAEGATVKPVELIFRQGTLVVNEISRELAGKCPGLQWDDRTLCWRALGNSYRDIISFFHEQGHRLIDQARLYQPLTLTEKELIVPRTHQQNALDAWLNAGRKGVVSLPTGSGKSILGLMAIKAVCRPTLVVVPTIDLMQQWHGLLTRFLGDGIGMVGGGSRNHQPITVTTYDSALIDLEARGNQYGLLIFDECHHLPSARYKAVAQGSIAPFLLGLTATLERADGGESVIFDLLGPKVYEEKIGGMVSTILAPYDVVNIEIAMSRKDQETYDKNRRIYLDFVKTHRINFSSATGWSHFLRQVVRQPDGALAMTAYRVQKKTAQASTNKIGEVWNIICQHKGDRIIVFTDENEHAYSLGRKFVAPVLTHLTKSAERKHMLDAFRSGNIRLLVTSKVLNEGVDVPEANIAVVVSGSGTVREHVQRLGRILRHLPGKRAVMYELVSRGTNEVFVNKRRRQHDAYQKPSQI